MGPVYDDLAYFRHHEVTRKIAGYRRVLLEAERLLGRKGRILDIGAGRGEALVAARERGWDAEGTETSSSFAEYASRTHGVMVHVGTLERLDLPRGSYDLVILGAVLNHTYDPLALLRQARRLLCDGGLCWIEVPNENALFFRVGNFVHHLRGRDWVIHLSPTFEPYTVHGFARSSLQRALTVSGFRPLSIRTQSGRPMTNARGVRALFEVAVLTLVERAALALGSGRIMVAWAKASEIYRVPQSADPVTSGPV